MANDLRVRVSSLTSTVAPLGITDAQMSNNIRDYCEARGIDTSGGNQVVLDLFTADLWDSVHRIAKEHRKRKKHQEEAAAIDSEVDEDLGGT